MRRMSMRNVRTILFACLFATALVFWVWQSWFPKNPHAPNQSRNDVFATLASVRLFTLPNGLTVVAIPDHGRQKLLHTIWYRAGSLDDPAGKSGLAHFVEHVTFRDVTVEQWTAAFEHMGGESEALTTYGYTVFYQAVSDEYLETVMQLEASRMMNVAMTDESLELERQEVIVEREKWIGEPHAFLNRELRELLYPDNPYGRPVIGWPWELEDITREDAARFYRQWYAPNNAVVVVYGDVIPEAVHRLAQKYYGSIPAGELPIRTLPPDPEAKSAASSFLIDEEAKEMLWMRSYDAPSYSSGAGSRAYALELLKEILSERLRQSLPKRLVKEVVVDYSPDFLGRTNFSLHVHSRLGTAPNDIAKAVDQELQPLITNGPTAAELKHAREDVEIGTSLFKDEMPFHAALVGSLLVTGVTLETLREWPKKIHSITANDIREAARLVFVPDIRLGSNGRVPDVEPEQGEVSPWRRR